MKRSNLSLIAMLIFSQLMFAGGLVTNTNQSAAWARTLAREATLGVDAIYYNPAGLGTWEKGLHLSLSNQTILQTRTITSDYTYLTGSPKSYEAELVAPIFPSIYAAYKLDKWAFSAGFNIIGGGGTANFEAGLPSFEVPVSSLVPMLQGALNPIDLGLKAAGLPDPGYSNVTGYNMDASFTGSSVYYGIQLGATYAINDLISVALGGRYVMASNSYEGSLANVTMNTPEVYGGKQSPGDYLRTVATNQYLNAQQVAVLQGTAVALDAATADASLKAVQTGSGFSPIIGVNLHFSDLLNVAVKYEHQTKIELTNDTEVDDVEMFPDGEKTRGDLPGLVSVGAQVKPMQKLTASVGFDYFIDKPAYYGDTDENMEQVSNESSIDENGYSINLSLGYKFLGLLEVSAGFSTGNLGVNDNYQSDLSYANKSNTVAAGVGVDIGEIVTLNAGVVFVMYEDYTKAQSYQPMGFPQAVPFSDIYGKNTTIFAIGVDIRL